MALQSPFLQKAVESLNKTLREDGNSSKKHDAVVNHIKTAESDTRYNFNLEFPQDSTWFNTSDKEGLSFSKQLKGKLTILDFFTYCCINCIHILPDLHKIEQRFTDKDGVVIIGVHSAKFSNEKGSFNILNAILRYNITHPVINDVGVKMWEELAISCWPTLVLVGPNGHLLYYIIGEGHYLELEAFVESAVRYYRSCDSLVREPIGIVLERDKHPQSELSFPGKIATDHPRGEVYISDTSNHRVLVVDRLTGLVKQVYGSGLPGFSDGVGQKAEFNSPQGLAYCNGCLYVADTENHLIRKIDLSSHSVVTVAGTGSLGEDKIGGKIGREQEISSPWDLSVSRDSNILYIAMAGNHQIWAYFIEDANLFKNSYKQGTVIRMCGSGDEANKNNSFPFKASLAQPSGLDLNTDGSILFVADSESSTIRSISTVDGGVKGLVGGALDPMDLFAFGDVDGKARNVRLQHPLGVAWDGIRQLLYIADSYNHKIKSVNITSKVCTTLSGNGAAGLVNGGLDMAQYSEPGGLCMGDNEGKTLLIADTNNHCVRVVDLIQLKVNQLKIYFPAEPTESAEFTDMPDAPNTGYVPLVTGRAVSKIFDPVEVSIDREVTVCLNIELEKGFKLSDERASLYQLVPVPSVSFVSAVSKGSIDLNPINFRLKTTTSDCKEFIFKVELVIFYCSMTDGVCLMKQFVLSQPIVLSDSADSLCCLTCCITKD